ncbi:MAG: phytanoyl-CoA dioxygenase family protein [Pacificimonas sp.]|jgi:ectoine hydroxylase-related dioxygenase (phytanoyl-CoA dioxygenase family)|nr:phytanoyl-CoA dioxygenase family protein [Pacificimonas sp.]
MTDLPYLPASTSPKVLSETLAEHGAAIVEDVLSAQETADLRAELSPFVEATDMGRDDFTGRYTRRTGALAARSQACRDLIMHDLILKSAETFLKPYTERIQLHLTQVIAIGPGQKRQELHRDRLAWGGYIPREIEPQFNTIWAVTDFTEENGATCLVPGSNKWDDSRGVDKSELRFAEMKAGSVLVYSGSVIHGGGANRSEDVRMGLNITYTLGWLRQEENQYLSCPPHIAKDLDPDLRALLGYQMGSYALGYFTPPLPAGEGPESVPPEALFGEKTDGWGADLYAAVSGRVRGSLSK